MPFQVQQGCAVLGSAVGKRELEQGSWESEAQSNFLGLSYLPMRLPGKFTRFSLQLRALETSILQSLLNDTGHVMVIFLQYPPPNIPVSSKCYSKWVDFSLPVHFISNHFTSIDQHFCLDHYDLLTNNIPNVLRAYHVLGLSNVLLMKFLGSRYCNFPLEKMSIAKLK